MHELAGEYRASLRGIQTCPPPSPPAHVSSSTPVASLCSSYPTSTDAVVEVGTSFRKFRHKRDSRLRVLHLQTMHGQEV